MALAVAVIQRQRPKPLSSASSRQKMLEKHLNSPRSAVSRHLGQLRRALIANKVQANNKEPSPFIFLCGANRADGGISARRVAIERFIRKEIPDARAIIAETFMEFLEKPGRMNLYDIENTISLFADTIVIVLESYSAFTELGAFASKDLRSKLFIVNDAKFKTSQSFINLGPLRAISDISRDGVNWYDMRDDGIELGDGIGTTFPSLKSAITSRAPKNESLNSEMLKPAGEINRWAFAFCHDLIFMARKITINELVEVYTYLYGKSNFDYLPTYKALLVALDFVTKSGDYLVSKQNSPILRIPINRTALQASFIAARHHLKSNNA